MGDVHCVFRGFISLSIGYHDILRVSSLKNDILNDSVNATKTRMVFSYEKTFIFVSMRAKACIVLVKLHEK